MANQSIHRRLFMHSAHGTVGVSGNRGELHPFSVLTKNPSDSWVVENPVVQIALVANAENADACRARNLLEQAICLKWEAEGQPVAFHSVYSEADVPEGMDAVVVFGQGFHIASGSTSAKITPFASPCLESLEEPMTVSAEESPLKNNHLEGFQPFETAGRAVTTQAPSPHRTVLLVGKTAQATYPVAWLYQHRHAYVFSSLVGRSEDFRKSGWIRLVSNVLKWACCGEMED
jgi:hypothetical protein